MEKEVIDWLLEGPAWLRYATELQLLDAKPDAGPALRDGAITGLVARLKSDQGGLPALKSGRVRYTDIAKAYWDLFILADIGFRTEELGITNETEEVFRMQSPDGTFSIPPNVKPNYFCMSAILIASLARMGYRDDPRLEKYLRAMLREMGKSGWDCYGIPLDGEACPMDNLNALMLLGQYEKYRRDDRLNGGIDLLLGHWAGTAGYNLYGFGVGRRFRSLQYPAVKYGILRVLDVLSLFPYATGSKGFRDMLNFVRCKAGDGKYRAEMTPGDYLDFDFSRPGEPSRWITFLVNRIEKRAATGAG